MRYFQGSSSEMNHVECILKHSEAKFIKLISMPFINSKVRCFGITGTAAYSAARIEDGAVSDIDYFVIRRTRNPFLMIFLLWSFRYLFRKSRCADLLLFHEQMSPDQMLFDATERGVILYGKNPISISEGSLSTLEGIRNLAYRTLPYIQSCLIQSGDIHAGNAILYRKAFRGVVEAVLLLSNSYSSFPDIQLSRLKSIGFVKNIDDFLSEYEKITVDNNYPKRVSSRQHNLLISAILLVYKEIMIENFCNTNKEVLLSQRAQLTRTIWNRVVFFFRMLRNKSINFEIYTEPFMLLSYHYIIFLESCMSGSINLKERDRVMQYWKTAPWIGEFIVS